MAPWPDEAMGGHMLLRSAAILIALLGVAGCDALTLKPAVRDGAVEYGVAMSEFTDKALLTNILRARDYAPLNFNDLSSITGSFSASGSLGYTIPLGPGPFSNKASISSGTGLQYSVSPSITMSNLNSQAFMMTMIQPISQTYVLSKWNEGYDHQLLLYLFVKSIKFCDDPLVDPITGAPEDATSCSPKAQDTDKHDAVELIPVPATDPVAITAAAAEATQKAAKATQQVATDLQKAADAPGADSIKKEAGAAAQDAARKKEAAAAAQDADRRTQEAAAMARQVADMVSAVSRTPNGPAQIQAIASKVRAVSEKIQTAATAIEQVADHIHQSATKMTSNDVLIAVTTLDATATTLEVDARAQSAAASGCLPLDGVRRIHRNDPDDHGAMADFVKLVDCLVDDKHFGGGDVDLKSLMILDPLGNPVPFGETVTVMTPASASGQNGQGTSNMQSGQTIAGPSLPPAFDNSPKKGAPKDETAKGQVSNKITYYVRVTYVTKSGNETLPSPANDVSLDPNLLLKVQPTKPPPPATGEPAMTDLIGFNVYVGTSPGSEIRRNASPIGYDIDKTSGQPTTWQWWTEPEDGLKSFFGPPPSTTQYATYTPGSQNTIASDLNVFTTINGLTDGQLHADNAKCPPYLKKEHRCAAPADSPAPYVQFYKEYPAQIVLCVRTLQGEGTNPARFDGHVITPISESRLGEEKKRLATARPEDLQELKKQLVREDSAPAVMTYALAGSMPNAGKPPNQQSNAGTGSAPAAAGAAGGGAPGGGGVGTGNTAGAMGQVTLALQPNRISAIIDSRACDMDQIVLKASTEEEFDKTTTGFAHIEWRSIAEVIQYLGAIARNQNSDVAPRWKSDKEPCDESDKSGNSGKNPRSVFLITDGISGRITVNYFDHNYSVGHAYNGLTVDRDSADQSLRTLGLLNELIDIAKTTGSLPVPQPVQVLP